MSNVYKLFTAMGVVAIALSIATTVDAQNAYRDIAARSRSQTARSQRAQHQAPRSQGTIIRAQSPSGWGYPESTLPRNQPIFGGTAVSTLPGETAPRYTTNQPLPGGQPVSGVPTPSQPVPWGAAPTVAAPRGGASAPYHQQLQNPPGGSYGGPQVPYSPLGNYFPQEDQYVDLDTILAETQTGKFMIGVGINSDAGVLGNISIDERNFDWRRPSFSWEDWRNGTAFRGGGQRFRIDASPGSEVQRYTMNFQEPYFLDSAVSLGLSGFFYNRNFTDWDEERLGGRVSLGYTFPERPDLSVNLALRAESIEITDPRVPTPDQLKAVLGDNELYSLRLGFTYDTRDNAFLPSRGRYVNLGIEQAFGTFEYARVDLDMRRYFVVRQRPDGSGKHVFTLSGKAGISGKDTPLFEHYFAGGFSTIRGFDFRGASPVSGGVIVGGELQILTAMEYRFPLSPNDGLFGSFFLDVGTVEETSRITGSDVRITPGFELRISVPAMGPVPIAVGLGFPVQHEDTDNLRAFHFFVGFSR